MERRVDDDVRVRVARVLVDRIVGVFGRANVCLELQRHFLRDEETDNEMLRGLAEVQSLAARID